MYKAKYINPYHDKKGKKKEYTLTIEDESGALPPMRISKKFKEDITQEEMVAEVQRELIQQLLEPDVQVDTPSEE